MSTLLAMLNAPHSPPSHIVHSQDHTHYSHHHPQYMELDLKIKTEESHLSPIHNFSTAAYRLLLREEMMGSDGFHTPSPMSSPLSPGSVSNHSLDFYHSHKKLGIYERDENTFVHLGNTENDINKIYNSKEKGDEEEREEDEVKVKKGRGRGGGKRKENKESKKSKKEKDGIKEEGKIKKRGMRQVNYLFISFKMSQCPKFLFFS
jgi:hypothetical protein